MHHLTYIVWRLLEIGYRLAADIGRNHEGSNLEQLNPKISTLNNGISQN